MLEESWFNPKEFYADGFPASLTSAVRTFSVVAEKIKALIAMTNVRRILEIGPGEAPMTAGPSVVYLDVVTCFLAGLNGGKVAGAIQKLPFKKDAFELVVAVDVLPHVPANERVTAMREMMRVAPRVLVFNQELGMPGLRNSYVRTADIERVFKKSAWGMAKVHYDSTAHAEYNEFGEEEKRKVSLDIVCAAKPPGKG